jgi:hypothetical protein
MQKGREKMINIRHLKSVSLKFPSGHQAPTGLVPFERICPQVVNCDRLEITIQIKVTTEKLPLIVKVGLMGHGCGYYKWQPHLRC